MKLVLQIGGFVANKVNCHKQMNKYGTTALAIAQAIWTVCTKYIQQHSTIRTALPLGQEPSSEIAVYMKHHRTASVNVHPVQQVMH